MIVVNIIVGILVLVVLEYGLAAFIQMLGTPDLPDDEYDKQSPHDEEPTDSQTKEDEDNK